MASRLDDAPHRLIRHAILACNLPVRFSLTDATQESRPLRASNLPLRMIRPRTALHPQNRYAIFSSNFILCWLLGTSVQKKGPFRAIYTSHFACRREGAKVESESMHVFHTLVPFFLFAKEKPVFPVLIFLRQRLALCFHALHDGIIRWLKPHSTSLLLGTIADLARGKSELLIENALLRQQLIILRRQVKRPACRKADRFLLVFLARMIRTWRQALFIVQPETLRRVASGAFPLVHRSTGQRRIRDSRNSLQRQSH
jgi:hypothetical protein